jgi:lysozyme
LQSKDEKYVNEGKYEASELYHFESIEELIKYFEGRYLKAYDSPFGNMKIGYGHAGPEIHRGMTISEERCEEIFNEDLEKAKKLVSEII